jgi:hypothetical protein
MYEKWLDGDSSWAGATKKGSNGKGAAKDKPVRATPGEDTTRVPASQAVDAAPVTDIVTASAVRAEQELFDYKVALVDSNVTAILRLPRTYTTGDAVRMAALINALAVPNSSSPSSDA